MTDELYEQMYGEAESRLKELVGTNPDFVKHLRWYRKVNAPYVSIVDEGEPYHDNFHVMVIGEDKNIICDMRVKTLNEKSDTRPELNEMLLRHTGRDIDAWLKSGELYFKTIEQFGRKLDLDAMLDFGIYGPDTDTKRMKKWNG